MKKYEVRICTGTLCHVLGGSELPALADHLPDEYKDKVIIKGSTCIEHCRNKELKPPFVEIDGDVISEASIEKLVNELTKRIQNDAK